MAGCVRTGNVGSVSVCDCRYAMRKHVRIALQLSAETDSFDRVPCTMVVIAVYDCARTVFLPSPNLRVHPSGTARHEHEGGGIARARTMVSCRAQSAQCRVQNTQGLSDVAGYPIH
eukprot:scaffold28078_cov57-Phaeocystis_antarctica.AAC.3